MTKTTRLNQTGSILRLDRGKKAVFMMLFALFSTFLAQSQCALTWNTQPPKFQRICIPFSTLTPRLQVAAVTCPGGNLSYQWQKKRPVSVGGTGLWEDISPFAAGYIGGNTPTLDITVADSITGGASYYEYRNVVISTGGINPCISGGSTACPYQSDTSNVSKIVGVRKPTVKYSTALDTTVCQYVGGLNPDQTYTLKARIIGVSNFDTLKYTWRTVNMPGFVHSDLSAHPNYTGWITTGFPGVFSSPPDSGTLIKTLTLNNANNTPLILGWDQSRFYLEINSPTCGISDTNTVPKRKLTVNPVPNVTITTPNKSICENDAFTLGYNVTNARHDTMRSGPVSWKIRVSGDAQLKALLIAADTTGTGNVNKTISIPASHGLSVGIHIVNVSWILNTTDPGACQRDLAAAQITVNVYPKPFVEFLTPNPADTTMCQGGSGVIKFKVSNATFNGNDIGWSVSVNDPSGILAPATLTGQGNKTVINTIPTTLPIGQHVVTLTGINTSGTPSICSGFVIGITSDTIKVLPTPDATMNTTVTIDKCQGFSKDSFVVVVSNAVYPGPSSNVKLGWTINYTDPTGTITGVLQGVGDTSIKFVTSAILPLGTNTITLNSITLVSPNSILGVIPTCSKTLVGQSKSYRVYPTPTASFSRNGMDSACEGSTPPSISLNVSGAQYTPNPALAWKVSSSGKFWAAAAGSVDTTSVDLTSSFIQGGSGNGSFNFTPPSTLAPGMYTLYLDTISLTNTPKCLSALADTFVWHIFPQPIATIIGTNMLDSICEGTTVNYSIAVSNVYYEPFAKSLKWTLNYSNGLGGTIGASPKIGIGPSVLGAYITSSGLTTGNRSLELLDITNNTNGCFNDLPGTEGTNTKLTRRIYPKPRATISTSSINICEGSSSSFTVSISNAVKQPGSVDQPWSLSTIGTFESAVAGSPSVASTALTFPTTGTGNGTITVNIPDTLPAGRYIYTLNNPSLTVSPLNCVGSTTSPSQIVINVYPKPTLLVTPAIDSTCQGVSRQYTVAVGNAYYEPNSGPINWRIRYSNEVGAGSAPSNANGSGVITGTGNLTKVYNSASINIAGVYEFRVDSLSNTTNTCKYDTKDTFRLIVKQRPSLKIVAHDSEVCFRHRATVNYRVDSVAVGQEWSFTYNAINTSPGGTKTITGVGPTTTGVFVTDSFTTSGAGTISFSPIILTASGGCVSTKTLPSINLNVAYVPDVTSNTTNGTGIICGNAATGASTVQFNITTTNMIVGSVTKNWKITYDIIGTQDTSLAAGSQIFQQLGLTLTGTGNGAFTFTSPHQTYNGTSADAGIADIRRMVIRKIEFTGVSPLNCSNLNIADSITTFTVNPRPRFVFTKLNADHVCVTSPVITGYNIFGFKAGDVGTFSWNGTNPTTSPNNVNISGPSIISGSITTVNTTFPGLSTQTVTNVTNSTTGCQAILDPQPKDTTIVDPPSIPGTLNGNATVCEGNNSGTLYLSGTIVGKVQYWEYSENDGFTWLQFANTDTFYHYTNASLTRRWRVVVKNLTCPINRSNEVIVFVHPQPKVQIANYTSGLCVGDSIRFTISVTGVPTNHSWKFDYTKTGFSSNNGNATLTGRGSGNFTYTFGGMTASALTGTIQLGNINNDTTNCNNNYSTSAGHLMTIVVGSNSVAGPIVLVASPNISLPTTVCKGSTVKLKYTGAGNVLVWYNSNSTSGSFPNGWDSISSTSTTQTYYSIDSTTNFRVKVKFGSCAAVVSSANHVVNVRSLPTASILGSDTICENGTFTWTPVLKGDPNLSIALTWLEGSTGKSGTFSLGSNPPSTVSPSTITTSVLTTTTSVILQTIQYTNSPACPQLLYTNAIATATVNPEPTATINSVTTPVCQGSTSPISFTVAGVASTTTWKLNYKVGGVRQTPVTGTGGGTFVVNTPALNTAGNVTVQFDTIFTTNIRTNCYGILTSGSFFTAAAIQVDATTTPGFVGDSVTICKGGRATINFTPGNGTITKWNISATGATGFYASQSSSSNSFYMSNIQSYTWFTATSKNGVCPEVTTAPVLVRTRELPGAVILSGSTTVCSGSSATLTMQIGGTFGNSWTIDYLEGATSKTTTGTGDGNFNITTSTLTTNTDITLQRITMNNTTTSVNPSCGPVVLTSTATVNVNPNPNATLNAVQTPVCQSSTSNSNFTVTVSGVPTGQGWSLGYTLNSLTQTAVTNTGSGTFTFPLTLNTAGTVTLSLTTITNTGSTPNCITVLSGQTNDIIVDATTVAGTISNSAASVVCIGINSGSLSYSGGNGSIIRWEVSDDAGANWISTTTTSSTLNWSNLSKTTRYRVVVKNGSCLEATSAFSEIVVRPLPTATISGSQTICQGDSAQLSIAVNNRFGNSWAVTLLEGTNQRVITTPTFYTRALNGTTDITLQSIVLTHTPANDNPGGCPNTISSTATVRVTPMPNATINFATTPICIGGTSNVTFSVNNVSTGQAWSIDFMEAGISRSTTGSGPGTFTISTLPLNTAGTNVITFNSITTTSTSPTCTRNLTGQSLNIMVDALSVPGTVSSDQTVCKGANSGTVSVTGHNGAVVRWEYSTNGGSSWTTIANTTNSVSFSNLTSTRLYRVWTKNSACSEIVSTNVVTITINELPKATISINSGNNPICANTKGTYTVTTSNTYGQAWSLNVIEGSTSRTLNGTGDVTVDFETSAILSSNTTVALVSIATNGAPSCGPNTISGNVTFTVTPRPLVTLNNVTTPVCQGASTFATFQITTSNIAAGVGFAVTYSVGTTTGLTFTNTGSGTFTVTTSTPALNTAGTVTVTLTDITTTGLSPNCNTTPNGASKDIVVDATSVAGTVSSDQTVCKGANTGSVSVAGHNGTVVRWEYSTNSGASWTTVSNTTTSLTFTNLTTTTQYRVWTKNNTCSEIVSSNVATITVNELPSASISIKTGNNPICEGTNGTYTVTTSNTYGQTWSLSVIEGSSARTLTGTGNGSFDFSTASVLNSNEVISLVSISTTGTPSCGPNTISGDVTFIVVPLPTATIDMVSTPVCQGNTSKVQFTVSNVATGQGWSLSYTEAGTSKTTTGNGPGTYTVSTSALNTVGNNAVTFNSITVTSTTPNCTKSLTATDTIVVDATTVAGTISGKATVCKGSNSGTLTYSGGNGAIVRWEYSINGGSTWSATGTKASSYSYSNLAQTTNYRVIVKNSACLEAISAPDTITVREQPYATISGSTTICQNSSIGLTVTVSNTFGNPWTITYLEGTSTLTFTGSGDGNKTLTTSALTTTSDITLQSIQLTHAGTSSNPACGPNGLSSTATVNVTPLPTATLNNVITPICQGNASAFEFTVSNIATGQGWSMNYSEGSTNKTTTGNGPGTYTVSTSVLSAGTVTITLNSISTTGLATNCTRNLTGQNLDITVNPTTTVGALGTDVTVCKNLNSGNLTYNVGSSNGAVVRWESSTLSSAGPWTSISNTTNTQAYINISQTTYYRVIVKSGTCAEKESNVITVSVQEIPVAFVGGSSAICAGNTATLSISISNVAAGQRSILNYLEGTTSKTVNIFGTSGSITTSILNTNTDISLVSVTSIDTTISATFRKGCTNSTLTSTATVNVNALPTATLTSVGGPICQGTSTTYTVTVANVPTGQGWSLTGTIEGVSIAPAPSGTGSGTFTFSTPVLNNPPAATVAFTLVTNTTTGCVRALTESKNITVDATTTVGTIAADATVCKGSNAGSVDYTSSGTNGSILRWEYSTVSPATAFNGIFNTAVSQTYSNLTATTFYRAIVKNGVCAEVASNVVTITVRDLPNATIAGNNTICEGSSSNFTITVTNTFGQTFKVYYLIGSTLDSLVQTGDGTYTINSGVLTNTVDVTLISIKQISGTPQCSQAIIGTITITVNELPRASYTSVPSRLCQGSAINFTIDVSKVKTTQSWSLSYTVNAPSSSSASSESKTGQGSGSVSITTSTLVLPTTSTITLGTITNTSTGCATTLNDAKVITVDPTTVGGKLAISTKDTVCKGTNSGTLSITGNTGSVVRWESSTNNGSTWSTINSTSNSYSWSNLTQTTRFRAVVQSGVCNSVNSRDTTILVRELPLATVSSTTICAGNTASLTVTVSNTFGKAWTLTFLEGSTTRTLTGSGDGNFTLTTGSLNTTTTIALKSIQITGGTVLCSNTLSDVGTVTVNALPSASHDNAPSSVCHNNTVDFTINVDNVVVGQGWSVNYRVNTPTTTGSTFTRSGSGPGNFTITTPIFTNTSNTVRNDVIEIISITNTTTGCTRTSSVTRSIEVYPASVGGTTSATNSTLCANTTTTSDITVSGFVGKVVRWEYSDDNQATWTTYSNTASTITVSNLSKTREYRAVIVSGPCASANSTIVKITVIPTVDAVITGAPQICPGQTALFNVVVSNIAANDNWSLLYRVNGTLQTALTGKGPGNFPLSVGPPATSAAGTIIVKLESITNTTFNCANTALVSQAVATVHPNPIANFTVANSCKDSVAVFTNTSSIISGTIADFTWDFGDGFTSKTGNPTHAYTTTGNFNVKLKAVSAQGCSDEITKVITVNPRPVANFTFVNSCQNVAASFTGTSTIASGTIKSFFWNFGDGGTSSAQSPTHTYAAAGTYTVTLTVVSDNGCASTKVQSITIWDLPEPNFVANPVCEGLAMNFVNTSSIGVGTMTYNWSFAGQGTSTLTNPTHTFTGFNSAFSVTLTATSNNGCVKTLVKPVTVWANPIASFTVDSACFGDVSRFVNTSTVPSPSTDVIQEWFWDFGDKTYSTGKDPIHTYGQAINWSVSVRATTNKGCVNTATGTAVVVPLPVATIVATDTMFCDGLSSTLTGTTGMAGYRWTTQGTKGDSLLGTGRTIVVTKQGWYKLVVTSFKNGCTSDADSMFITVWQLPVADAGRDTSIDKGQTVWLKGKGAGLNGTYQWSSTTDLYEDVNAIKSTNGALQNVYSKPKQTISYQLLVTDMHGCQDIDSVTIIVRDEFVLKVHNVVTPNADGKNDTWIIDNIEFYPEAEVAIFNRYGVEIYNKTGYNNEWDGTYKAPGGDDLPDGAYYYVITMKGGSDKVYKGAISVIRNAVK